MEPKDKSEGTIWDIDPAEEFEEPLLSFLVTHQPGLFGYWSDHAAYIGRVAFFDHMPTGEEMDRLTR